MEFCLETSEDGLLMGYGEFSPHCTSMLVLVVRSHTLKNSVLRFHYIISSSVLESYMVWEFGESFTRWKYIYIYTCLHSISDDLWTEPGGRRKSVISFLICSGANWNSLILFNLLSYVNCDFVFDFFKAFSLSIPDRNTSFSICGKFT